MFERFTPGLEEFLDFRESLSDHYLAPYFSGEEALAFQARYPEIQFYRRRDDSRSRLAFALWNQSQFRQMYAGRYTASMHLIRAAWNVAARFSKAPSFPPTGHAWRQMEISFVNPKLIAGTDVDAFACAQAWEQGCHFVNRIYNGLNQIEVRPKGLYYKTTAHLYSFAFDHESPIPNLGPAPVFVDLGFV